jgi:hypothetical protein
MATFDEWRPGNLLIETMRVCGLDEWRPGDLLIYVLRFCGLVALVGGVLLAVLGVLSGSPEPLDEAFDDVVLIEQGGEIAFTGAVLWAASWALRRLLGRT